MIIFPQFTEKNIYQIKLKENLLSKTENHKYFGVTIDKNLSWKPHIMTITSKLSKLCGLLYKLRPFVNKQILMQVYYTLICPNLLYGITCWGSCSKTASQPIQIIQNIILRCINMIGLRQIYVSELYILSNVLKVHYMYYVNFSYLNYVLKLCKFLFRYKHNLLPNVFLNKFC